MCNFYLHETAHTFGDRTLLAALQFHLLETCELTYSGVDFN